MTAGAFATFAPCDRVRRAPARAAPGAADRLRPRTARALLASAGAARRAWAAWAASARAASFLLLVGADELAVGEHVAVDRREERWLGHRLAGLDVERVDVEVIMMAAARRARTGVAGVALVVLGRHRAGRHRGAARERPGLGRDAGDQPVQERALRRVGILGEDRDAL